MGRWIETKVKPRKWKFKYVYYTKRRPKRYKSKIKAKQYAVKTSANTYKLKLIGKRR